MKEIFFILKEVFRKPQVTFMLGISFALIAISIMPYPAEQMPFIEIPSNGETTTASPQDHIKQEQIQVYNDRVIIGIQSPKWATFEDTGSMLPVLNHNSHAIQIEPVCPDEIAVGDIVSYQFRNQIIIHRVIHIDWDEQGIFFILKGDNNPNPDPSRVRCDQIQRKLVAIIY